MDTLAGSQKQVWQDGRTREVRTPSGEQSHVASNLNPTTNRRPGASQAGSFINVGVPDLGWTFNLVSRLPTSVDGRERSHGVLCGE